MPKNLACILLLIAISEVSVLAQDPEFRVRVDVTALAPKDERWLELHSKNFLLVGNTDEDQLRRLAADFELFREQFALFFPRARMTSSVPTTVVVFRDEDTFRPFRRLKNGVAEDGAGYLQPGTDVHYIVMKGTSPTRAIYREYIRTLMPDSMGPVPGWFRIGLPEYFTTYRVTWSGDSRWIEIGGRDKEFNVLLGNDALIPLNAFFEMKPNNAGDIASERDSTLYAQSWALTHYLFQQPQRRDRLMRFFQLLVDGVSTAEGFENAFNMDLKRFEGKASDTPEDTGFRAYVMESRIGKLKPPSAATLGAVYRPRTPGGWWVNLAGFSLEARKSTIQAFFYKAIDLGDAAASDGASLVDIPVNDDSTWADVKQRPVRLMSEAETHFHRGNLMLHIDRKDESEGFLQLAVRIEPRLAGAHAAMGLLRSSQGQYEAANVSLKQAVALGPNDYLAHYYTALNIRKQGEASAPLSPDQLDVLAAEFTRTVELAPHFVEASQRLAEVNVQRRKDLDETIDLLSNAIKQSPGRESLVLTLAQVLAANHNTREAEQTLNRIDASRTVESFIKDAVAEVRDSLRAIPAERGAIQEFFGPPPAAEQQSIEVREASEEPVGVLVPLRPVAAQQGETITGKLTALDCERGVTVVLESEGRSVRLHSDTPNKLEFLRHTLAVGTAISCGPFSSVPVVITYRPGTAAGILGEPVRIEFLETEKGR